MKKNIKVFANLVGVAALFPALLITDALGKTGTTIKASETNSYATVTEYTEFTMSNLDTQSKYDISDLGAAGENIGNVSDVLPSAEKVSIESKTDEADSNLSSPQNVNFETGEPEIQYTVVAADGDYVTREWGIKYESTDFDLLCKLVEAEAGGQGYKGQVLVADVILNRVLDSHFPDNIHDVIYANHAGVYQFSCIPDGRFDSVVVSDSTKLAVADAMAGVDYSDGVLYFCTPAVSDKWHNKALKFAFRYKGHNFYWRKDE